MTPADRILAASGEMPERPKGVDSKSTVSLWHRGFESLSLRQSQINFGIYFLNLANIFADNHGGEPCEALAENSSDH
jgi:hypothetical protein